MKAKITGVALLSAALSCLGFAQNSTYQNASYGYSITYPSGLLLPLGESDEGDVQTFVGGDARLLIWANPNPEVLGETLESLFNERMSDPNREVTYQVLRDDWFVISGYEAEKIFYEKTFVRGGVEYTFSITYAQEVRATFDAVVDTLENSFTVPTTRVFSDAPASEVLLFDGKIAYEVDNSACAAFDAPTCLAVTSGDDFDYINTVVSSYSNGSTQLDGASYAYEVGVFATTVSKVDNRTTIIVLLSD
jgi:hypothetical protein